LSQNPGRFDGEPPYIVVILHLPEKLLQQYPSPRAEIYKLQNN